MADPTVKASLVPKTIAGDIDALATAVDAVAGTDVVSVDKGKDGMFSIDVEVTDAVEATAVGVITSVLAAVDVVHAPGGENVVEKDPTLSAPTDVSLDVSAADVKDIIWTVTPQAGAKIKSIVVNVSALAGTTARRVYGNPQGHESQKRSDNKVILRVGPATAVHAAQAVTLTVTDTKGRTSAVDSVNVTAVA